MAAVCWIDIGCDDPAAAADFYATLFGWTCTAPDPAGYRLALLHGRPAAGLGPAEDPGPPYWTVVVGTDDIATSVRRGVAAGARVVVAPAAVGTRGWSAVTTDAVGAPLSWWQPGIEAGLGVTGEPGSFAGIELLTTRPTEAAAFYAAALGWEPDGSRLTLDGTPVAVLTHAAPPEPVPRAALWLVHFATDDIDGTAAAAVRLGAVPVLIPASATAVLRDPAGALFGLVAAA